MVIRLDESINGWFIAPIAIGRSVHPKKAVLSSVTWRQVGPSKTEAEDHPLKDGDICDEQGGFSHPKIGNIMNIPIHVRWNLSL